MPEVWYAPKKPLSGRDYWVAVLRKQPSAILLAIQLLAILLLPWLEAQLWGRLVFVVISFFAVTIAAFVTRSTPSLTWLALLIGFPCVALEAWSVLSPDNVLVGAVGHFGLAAFYLYVAYGLVSYVFSDSWVTSDELFAVGAAFTVLLFAFAYLYLGVQFIWPDSFTGHVPGPRRSFLELLFFSAANLTSVGLSDVGAIRPHARAVTIIEQLTGVMYVAMVISRLVALTVAKARR
ncbi:two pore domain potassium channel family protein [Janibacter melonis]|uniref:Two pore domain potassium channel family protein n=1 Tax=Janibacter melonis TaxID=262209 RepID=A0A5P8FKT2_9MICO|nr:ion channel [Janibacter melonis]QFQ29888.2 two pore domain potassium channel family protein [Janibacter melonis]